MEMETIDDKVYLVTDAHMWTGFMYMIRVSIISTPLTLLSQYV
jgi:hypothetical protein